MFAVQNDKEVTIMSETCNTRILDTVKKSLGLTENDPIFDPDIIMHINTVLANLIQMGVGPESGFVVEDISALWSDFTNDDNLIQQVKTYVCLKVRLLFDPPTSSVVMNSINETLKELEWRLYVKKDNDRIKNGE